MIKFCFYVPESSLEKVKESVFLAGAGKIGNYNDCCWQTLGQGQFKPNSNATPFIGENNQLSSIQEWKVEMVVSEERLKIVIEAFKDSHPYEKPAYECFKMLEI